MRTTVGCGDLGVTPSCQDPVGAGVPGYNEVAGVEGVETSRRTVVTAVSAALLKVWGATAKDHKLSEDIPKSGTLGDAGSHVEASLGAGDFAGSGDATASTADSDGSGDDTAITADLAGSGDTTAIVASSGSSFKPGSRRSVLRRSGDLGRQVGELLRLTTSVLICHG